MFGRSGFRLEALTTEGKLGDDLFNVVMWKLKRRGMGEVTRGKPWKLTRGLVTHGLLKPMDTILAQRAAHSSFLATYSASSVEGQAELGHADE